MLRLKLMFIPMVVLIFAAGMVVGRISNRAAVSEKPATQPAATQPSDRHSPSWLHDQLGLNVDQRQKMDAIWNDVRQKTGGGFEKWRALDKERDQALQALLTPEQKTQYDAILKANRDKRAELDKEREKLLADANEKSKALLTEEQKKKWDELTKEMRDHRGPGGPRGRGDRGPDRMGPGGNDRPPTRPSNGEPPQP
jgi:Spy/CpxP family protein refolding chaperone